MSALDPNERPEPAPVMAMSTGSPTLSMAEFIIAGKPPVEARQRAAIAVCDTVGVILAGAPEAAADIIRRTIVAEARGHCHALGIAASLACGIKENLGSMVKPLHAGMAAHNGVIAARLAKAGFVASNRSIDGPQGYLAAMDSQNPPAALADAIADLGSRWEI